MWTDSELKLRLAVQGRSIQFQPVRMLSVWSGDTPRNYRKKYVIDAMLQEGNKTKTGPCIGIMKMTNFSKSRFSYSLQQGFLKFNKNLSFIDFYFKAIDFSVPFS